MSFAFQALGNADEVIAQLQAAPIGEGDDLENINDAIRNTIGGVPR